MDLYIAAVKESNSLDNGVKHTKAHQISIAKAASTAFLGLLCIFNVDLKFDPRVLYTVNDQKGDSMLSWLWSWLSLAPSFYPLDAQQQFKQYREGIGMDPIDDGFLCMFLWNRFLYGAIVRIFSLIPHVTYNPDNGSSHHNR